VLTAIFERASEEAKFLALAARSFQPSILFCANLFTRAGRCYPRFPNLDLPQPLQNLFELGPNLFYPFVNLAFACAFFMSKFLVRHCELTLAPIFNMSYEL
jgi:hypothetical protein